MCSSSIVLFCRLMRTSRELQNDCLQRKNVSMTTFARGGYYKCPLEFISTGEIITCCTSNPNFFWYSEADLYQ